MSKTVVRKRRSTIELVAIMVLIALVALFGLATIDPSLGVGGDTAMYIMNARNIAEGHPYNATHYIQNPYSFLGPQAYPPGFPLLLAPVYAVFGLDIYAFNVFGFCLFIGSLILIAGYLRHRIPGRYPTVHLLAVIALVGLNPTLCNMAAKPLSDIAFIVYLVACLMLLDHAYTRFERGSLTFMRILGTGVFVYLLVSTRLIGVVLLPAIVFYDLSRFRRLTSVAWATIAVCLVLISVQEVVFAATNIPVKGAGAGYGAMMQTDLFSRLSRLPVESFQHLVFYATAVHAYWPRNEGNPWLTPFVGLTLLLAVGGFIDCLRRQYTVRELFVVLYVVALLPWSAAYWRYLIPVIPFYFFYMIVGLARLQEILRIRYPLLLFAVLIVAAFGYSIRYSRSIPDSMHVNRKAPNSSAAFALYDYIDQHTALDSVIIAKKPRILTLYTDRYASTFTYADRPDLTTDRAHLNYFRSIDTDYVLDGPPDNAHTMRKLADRHPEDFSRVYANAYFTLYRFNDLSR